MYSCTQDLILPTQQSTQGGTDRFIGWTRTFLAEYERRSNPRARGHAQFRQQFEGFMTNNLTRDGYRYKAIIRHFCVESSKDGGTLASQFFKVFFTLMDSFDMDSSHRVLLLRYFLKLFEVNSIDPVNVVELTDMYKEHVQKLSNSELHDVYNRTLDLIKIGQLNSYKALQLFVWMTTLPGLNLRLKTVLDKLLNECSEEAIGAVVDVIRDHDDLSVFHDFAAGFLKRGFSQSFETQKLGFSKIIAFLRNFSEPEIHDILYAFCETWTEKDAQFYCQLEDAICELTKVFHRHPMVGKAALKFFKIQKKYIRSSIFALICQIALCSSQRYQAEITKTLSTSLSKIWQFADDLKADGWIYEVIKDLKLHNIIEKFGIILEVLQDSPKIAQSLLPGIIPLAIQLIEAGARKSDIKTVEGRIEDRRNNVAFLGRKCLVGAVTANPDLATEALRSIATAICANSSKTAIAYFLIDALIEIRLKMSGQLVMNWEVFEKLAHNICELTPEVGVKVMAALMPVIVQRSGLRRQIFNALKVQMLSPIKVETALPIMFQLLRSLTEQRETKEAFQYSQSFATFSSQVEPDKMARGVIESIEIIECIKRCLHQSAASKCFVYKGIVDFCKKNNFFIIHGLDLLLSELKSLPILRISNYTFKTPDGPRLKYPASHLVKATSTVLTAAIIARENNPHQGSTQLINNGLEISAKAEELLNSFIAKVMDMDLEDMDLDKHNDDLTKPTVSRLFAYMMIQLYDVIIEHLWNSDVFGDQECIVKKVEKLILRRNSVMGLVEAKKSGKNAMSDVPGLLAGDLQIDVPKLAMMLESLDNPNLDNIISIDGDDESNKSFFITWLIHRIYDSIHLLDSKASTCLASSKSLTSMACSLLKFYFNEVSPDLPDDAAMKLWYQSKTKAIESYSTIMIYILSKYEANSAQPLEDIYSQVAFFDPNSSAINPTQLLQAQQDVDDLATLAPDYHQDDNPKDAGFSVKFRKFALKHIIAYYNQMTPALISLHQSYEARKVLPEYHKQLCAFFTVARKLTSMLTSSSDELRVKIMEVMLSVARRFDINEKQTTIEYWEAVLELIVQSNCSDAWMEQFSQLVDCLIRLTDDEDISDLPYKSLHPKITSQFYVIITKAASNLLAKIRTTLNVKHEIGDPYDDGFMLIICTTLQKVGNIINQIVDIDSDIVSANEAMRTGAVLMLGGYYQTLGAIVKTFLQNLSKTPLYDWESIKALDDLLAGTSNEIVQKSTNHFGLELYRHSTSSSTSKNSTKALKETAKVIQKTKRDEKLFGFHDKEFEAFHCSLILLAQKYGTEERPLTLPAAEQRCQRDFRIDTKMLKKAMREEDEGDDDTGDLDESED